MSVASRVKKPVSAQMTDLAQRWETLRKLVMFESHQVYFPNLGRIPCHLTPKRYPTK